MKQFFLFSSTMLFCLYSYAQDTIVKINGDKIIAKISEVSSKEIKYKKFDFQEGPTYIENKSNIQIIKYSNGSVEKIEAEQNADVPKPAENTTDYYSGPVHPNNKIGRQGNHFQYQGEAISERALHEVLFNSKDKQIIMLAGNAKDAKNLQYIGFGAIPLGVGALYFLSRNLFNPYGRQPSSDLTFSAVCLVGAISCPIASIYFKNKRNYSNRQAIKLYNERF